ncbi:aminopeptidase N [Kocuria sp. JC486]|uniref:aminopeptidase N n=1 Tax=Kocuria sp. JC486 TaxID=1970736 RepID=UPI00142201F3|nr:aminopeptidase N [Kocuria sp. JC486]
MPHYDLTRVDAARRSRDLTLLGADVQLDLTGASDPDMSTFPVTARWEFEVANGVEATFLDFIGEVDSLEVNGQPRTGADLEQCVSEGRIELSGLQPTNTVTVRGRGRYSRSGEGMHRYVDPEDDATYLYTQYEPTDARRVVPCFDQPDLRAPWRFTVDAPAGWSVSSNAADVRISPLPAASGHAAAARHEFSATAAIPSYLTTVLAGPYHRVTGTWESSVPGRDQRLPLTLWCRASMAPHLPAEELFELTRQGLDFYTGLFDLDFPFDSYEQAFVPEYNLGAMENPGLVTFTEDYLFPDGPTHQQRAARANTVLHEMAHMYFGDLVTIRWWEDLWLKESFAEYMGAYASAEATEFTSAWAGFAVRRKAWAYRQDALSTTHPILADIPDVAAARQNFDGITYAKGAAALKQLVAFVGQDAFFAACRVYFRRHAWGSADLSDFLAALEEASHQDTRAWARHWLGTTGATRVDVTVTRGDTGLDSPIESVVLVPRGTPQDPASARPHQLAIGLYGTDRISTPSDSASDAVASLATAWARTRRVLVEIPAGHQPGDPLPVPALTGAHGLVLVNDDDLDYAEYRLDAGQAEHLMEHLGHLPDPMARSVAWAQLWSAVRSGEVDPGDFLTAVLQHIFQEEESVVFETVLDRALEVLDDHLPVTRRARHSTDLTRAVVTQLESAPPGSDRQSALARVFGHLLAHDRTFSAWAGDLLAGSVALPGLRLGPTLRWRLLTGLVASGHADDTWIRSEADRDSSRPAQIGRARAEAARPTAEAKQEAWDRVLGPDLTNDLLSATAAGFQLGDDDLLAPFRARYFEVIQEQWASRSIGMATRVVAGLYPRTAPDPAAGVENDAVLQATEEWLTTHSDAPAALLRVVREQADERRRRLTIQARARPA